MHADLNINLIDMIKEHPEYFYDGVEIASCFGCFGPALWNGGRALAGNAPYERITAVIEAFNSRNVPIRYTFTNPTLEEKDLKDPFCNRLCKIAENGLNEIIVNVPFLEDYVRENYPKYPLISSTVKQIENYDDLMREFEKDYKLVVLDYNWNNDFEKLEKIPRELRSRCEILICPYCTPHCKRRGEHYRVLGESQRNCSKQIVTNARTNYVSPMKEAIEFKCPNTGYNFYQIQQYSTFVKKEDIYGIYLEMGFSNFKIEGRVLAAPNVVESYVYYMAKPEYRDRVRLELLTSRPKIKVERKQSSLPPASRTVRPAR
jgi:collagenase-like PrtC family protease